MQTVTIRSIILILLCGAVTLPIALCVVLGVGHLLDAMQDAAAAIVLGRIGLGLGILWSLDLVLLLLVLAAQVCLSRDEPTDIEQHHFQIIDSLPRARLYQQRTQIYSPRMLARDILSRKDRWPMILGKIWNAFKAQVNKVANFFWTADPIAQMQLEYDSAVSQLKDGREGLEQYRALVERVNRQVTGNQQQVTALEAKVKAYLTAGDRETAGKFVLELNKAKQQLAENQGQLKMHEEAYNNNLIKIKNATGKLADVREKIQKYDADLKMSRAEAEMSKLANSFNFDVTTDFGEVEQNIQDKIGLNRAKARVAADLSGQGLEDIKKEQAMENVMADQALKDFESQMGLATPATVQGGSSSKELGPTKTAQTQS